MVHVHVICVSLNKALYFKALATLSRQLSPARSSFRSDTHATTPNILFALHTAST